MYKVHRLPASVFFSASNVLSCPLITPSLPGTMYIEEPTDTRILQLATPSPFRENILTIAEKLKARSVTCMTSRMPFHLEN